MWNVHEGRRFSTPGLKAANELINPYGLNVLQEKVNQPKHVTGFVPFDYERLIARRGPIIIH